MLLEQHGGQDDGHAQNIRGRPHPAAARLVEAAAPAVADHQGHRVENVDGWADVPGGVNGIEHPHQTGEDVAAIHPVRPQSKPCGQKDITAQCDGHAGEEAQADPPEVAALAVPQQIEQA